jgi:hypothetical protein
VRAGVKAIFLCLLLLVGCSSNTAWKVSAGTPHPAARAHVHVHSNAAMVFGLALFAASIHEYAFADYPPEMDPNRRVSEQDCTKPLDYSLGNIRCK